MKTLTELKEELIEAKTFYHNASVIYNKSKGKSWYKQAGQNHLKALDDYEQAFFAIYAEVKTDLAQCIN
jgi:hypothetical protein